MKVCYGTDAGCGYVHAITRTSANSYDSVETANLIRKGYEVLYDDSGCSGVKEHSVFKTDGHLSPVKIHIN